jgi:hypothetical protein
VNTAWLLHFSELLTWEVGVHRLWCKTNMIPFFMHQMRISTNYKCKSIQWCSDRKNWKSEYIVKTIKKKKAEKPEPIAMKLNQILQSIELRMREIIFRFEKNTWNLWQEGFSDWKIEFHEKKNFCYFDSFIAVDSIWCYISKKVCHHFVRLFSTFRQLKL